uniref:Uncharacterized protein n=1 Tax=viral metagenome TaxID=1070528 RepID=A0A6M3M9U3_9ZZZZ
MAMDVGSEKMIKVSPYAHRVLKIVAAYGDFNFSAWVSPIIIDAAKKFAEEHGILLPQEEDPDRETPSE